MKRSLTLGVLPALAIAVASIVLAQASSPGTLRTPSGDRAIAFLQQSGQTYVSAIDVVTGLGGTVEPDSTGFKITIGSTVAAFGPDSRFAVVRDELIEMPAVPITVEARPYVPWQFFQGLLTKSSTLDAVWDAASSTLTVRPLQRDAVAVQVSVANVEGITKMVLTLSGAAEYTITREPALYIVHFKSPLRAPFAEQTYEDPYIARLAFAGSDLRIHLASPDVAGDAYQLQSPPRIVLDFRKGATPAPGMTQPQAGLRPRQDAPGIRTIVIDPGHGGKEVGAVGPNGLLEKEVTLAIARKLAASLSAKIGARIVLTREDDSLVTLDQRTALANQYKADLFLSIHLNAAVVRDARGSETYFLSLAASDELARKAAETENASASAAHDSSSDLKLILWDLAQQAYLDESSRFAQAIQEEMNAATGVGNRGVKQAPFKVLVGATMPAALVEVGFISNPDEEAKLQTDAFQDLMVEAVTRAVQRYKTDYETRIGVIKPAPAAPATQAPALTPATTSATPVPVAPRTGTESE
jgi:N-acetylmuramoyl-L-alanine amidase